MSAGQEEWRQIPGWPGYLVSDHGRVRSPHSWRGQPNRILLGNPSVQGYPTVTLCSAGERRRTRVHVLVAEAFLGPRPEGQVIRHLDGNQLNNRPENLRYGTPGENERDKVRHGTHPQAARTHCAKGHPYDAVNTRIEPCTGGRRCRACEAAQARRYNEQRMLRTASVSSERVA